MTPFQLKFGITTLNKKKQEETFFAAIVPLLSGDYKTWLKNKNEFLMITQCIFLWLNSIINNNTSKIFIEVCLRVIEITEVTMSEIFNISLIHRTDQ